MSKAKGNTGERELAAHLKNIFDGSFIRVPSSGAYTGGKNAYRKEYLSDGQIRSSKGDIIPPDFMPKLVLEVKFYKEFAYHQLFMPGGCSQLDKWIGQNIDAVDDGDVWFVVFKINRRGWSIAIPKHIADQCVFSASHCFYKSEHGDFVVTEAISYFEENKETLLRLCA